MLYIICDVGQHEANIVFNVVGLPEALPVRFFIIKTDD